MTSYSHSKLGTYLQCKQKYKFQYVEKIKSEYESVEAFMGKLVHATLEKLYKDLKFQKKNSKEELLAHFVTSWDSQWHDKIMIVKEYTAQNYQDMGKKFIADYYDHYTPFNTITTLGLETADLMPLANGNQYHVRIDRLACDKEGNYYVCDYKTNSALKAQEELDEDKQLAMYSLWVRQKYPDAKAVKLVWYFLAFDKEMISERNEEQLLQLKKQTEEIIADIEVCQDFPTTMSALCNYCAYKTICPAWKHEIELEEKTPEQFKDDDGVKMVDEIGVLEEQKKLAEERIFELKEKIISFAQQKGIEMVWGTDKKASVKPYDKIEYPKTQEFFELLRAKGYDVFTINYSKLLSKIIKRQVDVEILDQVKTEQGWMVRVSKRRGD
ncbi:PD-(D/E)XK nuclease family protein [Candidatus Woesearchaeota archaeon]|nr:PD-(D/E)XK nuclease family protein [Candidatus Woesearchaeota archaeon]